MLFDMRRIDNCLFGWISPDNPSVPPRIRILRPDGSTAELETNAIRPDVVEAGIHHDGKVGFHLDSNVLPDLATFIDVIEIRDAHTGILMYRPYREGAHIPKRFFRFELQAMPYAPVEAMWDRNFELYYSGLERFPFETLFGILNNPAASSIALSGRPSMNRYEHLFRERDYKICALLRHPLEELAERLLFVRYALAPQSATSFEGHLTGLKCLAPIANQVNLDRLDSMPKVFKTLTAEQKLAIENPLLKALVCDPEERPRKHHVQLALARLSTFDLVGVRSHYARYCTMLDALLGRDIFAGTQPMNISMIGPLSEALGGIKAVRSMLQLDIELYELAESAVKRVVGAAPQRERVV
jgi:hypothetical protein